MKDQNSEFFSAPFENTFSEYQVFPSEKYYVEEKEKEPIENPSYPESFRESEQEAERSAKETLDVKKLEEQLNSQSSQGTQTTSTATTSTATSSTSAHVVESVSSVSGVAASVGVTAVAVAVIISPSAPITEINPYENIFHKEIGADYVLCTFDFTSLGEEEVPYSEEGDDYVLIFNEREYFLNRENNTFLATNLTPNTEYSFSLNTFQNDEMTTLWSSFITTEKTSEPKVFRMEEEENLMFDSVTRTASFEYSFYLSDVQDQVQEERLFICSSPQNTNTEFTDIIYVSDVVNENNRFQGIAMDILSEDLYFYVVGSQNGVRSTLYEGEYHFEFEEGFLRSDEFLVDETSTLIENDFRSIQVMGKLEHYTPTYSYNVAVYQYDEQQGLLGVDDVLLVVTEDLSYQISTLAYYGVRYFRYDITYVDSTMSEVNGYQSQLLDYTEAQSYSATYEKKTPLESDIEYLSQGIRITVDTSFYTEYPDMFSYRLDVTNSAGTILGSYEGQEVAEISIDDISMLDTVCFQYTDIGLYRGQQIEFGNNRFEGPELIIPKISLQSEIMFVDNMFAIGYEIQDLMDYTNARIELEIVTATQTYQIQESALDPDEVSPMIILSDLPGEVGSSMIRATLYFHDQQIDGREKSVMSEQIFKDLSYTFQIDRIEANITTHNSSTTITIESSGMIPSTYSIQVTEEINSFSQAFPVREKVSFEDLPRSLATDLKIQVLDKEGLPWGEELSYPLYEEDARTAKDSSRYLFSATNPYDNVVTYNDDGTYNIYRDTQFETDDPNFSYRAGICTDVTYDELTYEISGFEGYLGEVSKERVDRKENLSADMYVLVYDLLYQYQGVDYLFEQVMPSGTIQPVCSDPGTVSYTRTASETTIHYSNSSYGYFSPILLVDGIEYQFSTYTSPSDFTAELVLDQALDVTTVTIYFSTYSSEYDNIASLIQMNGTRYRAYEINATMISA